MALPAATSSVPPHQRLRLPVASPLALPAATSLAPQRQRPHPLVASPLALPVVTFSAPPQQRLRLLMATLSAHSHRQPHLPLALVQHPLLAPLPHQRRLCLPVSSLTAPSYLLPHPLAPPPHQRLCLSVLSLIPPSCLLPHLLAPLHQGAMPLEPSAHLLSLAPLLLPLAHQRQVPPKQPYLSPAEAWRSA